MANPNAFFADAFMTSLSRGLLAGEAVRTQRERLKRDEEESRLRGKLLDLQTEKWQYELQKDLRSQLVGAHIGGLLGQMGSESVEMPGEPVAGAEATGERQMTTRGALAQALAQGGQTKEALGLFPELTQPSEAQQAAQAAQAGRIMQGVMGGGGPAPIAQPGATAAPPGPPAAPAEPAAPPGGALVGGAPVLSLRPTLNWSPAKGWSVSIAGQPTQFELKHQTLEDPPGSGQLRVFEVIWDPIHARVVSRYPWGGAAPPDSVQRAGSMLREGYGLKPDDPRYGRALGQILMATQLTGDAQNQALAEIDTELRASNAAQHQPAPSPAAPPGGGGGVAGAIAASQARRVQETKQKAEVEADVARREKPIGEADRLALQTQNNILAQLTYVKTFSRDEIQKFVGLLHRPQQEALLALRGVTGAGGSERFAQFKAAAERLRGSAFGEGGKQLTPFEASVVFGYTPTGREKGGATEFLAKLDNLEKFTKIARDVRLRMAKEPGGIQTPEHFDEALREGMKKAGISMPTTAGATFVVPMIVQDPAGKPYRLEPGEKLPDGWQALRPYPTRSQ